MSASTTTETSRLARLHAMQDVLDEVGRQLGPATELDEVLEKVLKTMDRLVDFKGGSICLVDGDVIRLAHSRPAVSQEVLDARLPIGTGLSGWIVANAQPVISADIRNDPQAALQSVGSNATIRSYVGVPLITAGTVIGLLQVDSAEPDAYDRDDLMMLRGIATHVAGAIEAARRQEDQRRFQRLQLDFIARVSHELRTPVTIINGFTSTLVDHAGELSPEQIRTFATRMRGAGQRLSRRVEEIVDLAALDAGLRGVAAKELVVVDALSETLGAVRGAVRNEIPPTLVAVTDPLILRHTVAPLLDNARRHAHGGRITANRADGRLMIDVTDDGPGVPEEHRDDLFERFSRGSHNEAGIGLGLAVADSLAGTAGGRVLYEPRGDGSRFRVVLPEPWAPGAQSSP